MCQFKSGIIMKDRVFVPDYDSHTDMLNELGIEDNVQNAQTKFIRAELIPTNGDVFSDISTWRFNVDQDILPDWYVEQYDKQRMIDAVKEWAKSHVHVGEDNLRIDSGAGHYIEDCHNVVICGNATVERICGNTTVNDIYGDATVKRICGNATVIGSPYGWNNKDKMTIKDNATFKDRATKTIWQAGGWSFKSV